MSNTLSLSIAGKSTFFTFYSDYIYIYIHYFKVKNNNTNQCFFLHFEDVGTTPKILINKTNNY
jgi:hypothetical protein